MLSWEYPPKNIGGLSEHIYNLSEELYKLGHEVHILTCEDPGAPYEEVNQGIFIHRVSPYKIETDDFTKWVMHFNFAIIQEGIKLINSIGRFDIIHAHDWLCTYSAKVLKCSYCIPMVCTIHATEHGRNNGVRTEMQKYISGAEWMIGYEAWKIVACSHYMKQEIHNVLGASWDKIWVIPNGIDVKNFDFSFEHLSFRRQFAKDNEKIVFFVGRHVYEKGIHILADAARQVIQRFDNVKFVIAGTGPMKENIMNQVYSYGINTKFVFTGYIDAETKNKLYRVADAAVFPSLYEPFGIVALEAMAAKCPVIVSDNCGLGELIEHKRTGLKTFVGSPSSLADNIIDLFNNEKMANSIKNNALKCVKNKYTWKSIAALTLEMYEMVKSEAIGTEWF